MTAVKYPEPGLAARVVAAEIEARRAYDWKGVFCPQAPFPWRPHWTPECKHARPEQLPPPGDWFVWFIKAGRGWGKTRTGAEWVRARARLGNRRIALVASTFADGRDTMVEGESGLLAVVPEVEWLDGSADGAWNRANGELRWANGSRAKIYSSERPRQLRGPQHTDAWGDEPAYWQDAAEGDVANSTWSNLKLGLRLGDDPRAVMTTTPRPVALLTGRPDHPGLLQLPTTIITSGSSMDNLANLAPSYRKNVIEPYLGTRLGRQEIDAEILLDVPGALWTTEIIGYAPAPTIRRNGTDEIDLARLVVAVDPNATEGEDADECGIVVAGMSYDGRGYLLADRSARVGPRAWAPRAVEAAHEFDAECIVVEANQGGDMARMTVEAVVSERVRRGVGRRIPVVLVTASRGKRTRAEPIAQLYEQGRVRHVKPFPELEYQLTHWTPESGESPDRLDALVWAFTYMMANAKQVDDGWGSGSVGSAVA